MTANDAFEIAANIAETVGLNNKNNPWYKQAAKDISAAIKLRILPEHEPTVEEMQAEHARLTQKIQFRVLGDPSKGVTLSADGKVKGVDE